MSDNKQIKTFTLKQLKIKMDEFNRTSFWTYLNRGDQENVERKIRRNIWYPLKEFFCNIKYWFLYRFHPKHRYKFIDTKLPYGYYDKDHLMLHGCFALLVDYVKFELGGVEKLSRWENKNWKDEGFFSKQEYDNRIALDREMKEIYNFWINVRPARKDPFSNRKNDENDSWFDTEQDYYNEDQKYLLRLIKIRAALWT